MEDKMKVAVHMQTWASATVTVELTDEELARLAADLEKSVDELTAEDVMDVAEEKAFNDTPSLCAHCSGMGYGSHFSMDLGDFESADEEPVEIVKR